MKKSHVALLLIAAFALGIFINKTYEIRQAHAASNYRLKVEMRKTRRCIASSTIVLLAMFAVSKNPTSKVLLEMRRGSKRMVKYCDARGLK